jgi:voltage-gated potassium channel Kch
MSSRAAVFRHLSGFWSEERNLSVLLGILIFDYFVLPSLGSVIRERLVVVFLQDLAFSLLLLTGVVSLTRYKFIQTIFALIVVIIIAVRWGRLLFGWTWLAGWEIFLSCVSSVAFGVVVLGHVYREGPMTSHRIQGAVAAYLLFAMAFSLAHFLVEYINPGSFQFQSGPLRLDEQSWKIFYYYSITTLTTLGYGDITPVHPIARNLAMVESLVGQLYPAILLARLVTLHAQTRR